MKQTLKNITLSDVESRLEELRRFAEQDHKTVNQLFREWSEQYIQHRRKAQRQALEDSFAALSFKTARKYSRDEMNER
jgi:hypothetical protein